jgi:hypothetical protein
MPPGTRASAPAGRRRVDGGRGMSLDGRQDGHGDGGGPLALLPAWLFMASMVVTVIVMVVAMVNGGG